MNRIGTFAQASILRFFVASLFGLVFDIALAAILYRLLGLPLIASTSISLLMAAATMYFVHEFWTFRSAAGRLSLARLSGTVLSAMAALATRSACLYFTSQLLRLGEDYWLIQIAGSTAFSFVLNYLLVRRIIGGRSTRAVSPPPFIHSSKFHS